MQFTHPPKRRDPRGQRKRKIPPRQRRGSFIDLKTIAAALLSRSFSLASLADFLKTPTRKAESGGHGKQLTERYLATRSRTFKSPGNATRPCAIGTHCMRLRKPQWARSSAKRALARPTSSKWACGHSARFSPIFRPHLTGVIMSAYFGGRAEVRWRREIRQVLYCDFLSMYPTVCTLMGLWRFVIAQGMEWSRCDRGNPGACQLDFAGGIAAARILAAADDHCSG